MNLVPNRSWMRRALVLLLLCAATAGAQRPQLPAIEGSVRFLVLGDFGTGSRRQYETAETIANYYRQYPFSFAILLGDNLYGGEDPEDYRKKFERPYQTLLDAGVKFYASLGNHDNVSQKDYEKFNMEGRRYYNFRRGPVEFFALDSTYMDDMQLAWLEKELAVSDARWKVAFFHHPLYSSARRHGSDKDLRDLLEPLFVRYGVDAVFSGHDHVYERIKPQKGIYYFVAGSGGRLRRGNLRGLSRLTAFGWDEDRAFLVVEITGDRLYFQAVSREGETVDVGSLPRPHKSDTVPAGNEP